MDTDSRLGVLKELQLEFLGAADGAEDFAAGAAMMTAFYHSKFDRALHAAGGHVVGHPNGRDFA